MTAKGKKADAVADKEDTAWQPPDSNTEVVERVVQALLHVLPHMLPTKPGTADGAYAFEELHRLRDHMLHTLEQEASDVDNPSSAAAPANKGGSK